MWARLFACLSCSFLLVVVSSVLPRIHADPGPLQQKSDTITFDDMPSLAPQGGTEVRVTTQYKNRGILFTDAAAVDYSTRSHLSGPEPFAFSPPWAIHPCWTKDAPCDKFAMRFISPQKRVTVRVGYLGALPSGGTVFLRALDASDAPVGGSSIRLDKSDGPIKIRTALEFVSTKANIVTAVITLQAESGDLSRLGLDDIEFETEPTPLPDLTVRRVGSRLGPGQQVVIKAEVENIAQVPSPATVVEARSDLWNGPVKQNVRALDPNDKIQVELIAPIPRSPIPGKYSYTLVVNPDSTIIEADTDRKNDSTDDQIQLKPDLTIQVRSGVGKGDRPFVSAEVTNAGHAQSPATEIQIQINMAGPAETAKLEALAPDETFQVNIPISAELGPGEYSFDAEVNAKHAFDEESFENNKRTAASLSIPRSWWWPPRPPWFFPAPVVVCILLGVLGVKVIRKVKRPPTQVNPTIPTIPTLAARPTLHPGTQSLELSDPNDGGIGVGVRLEMGALALQIDEPGDPAQEGHRL